MASTKFIIQHNQKNYNDENVSNTALHNEDIQEIVVEYYDDCGDATVTSLDVT